MSKWHTVKESPCPKLSVSTRQPAPILIQTYEHMRSFRKIRNAQDMMETNAW